jgi:DnaJ-class molecular chaperone
MEHPDPSNPAPGDETRSGPGGLGENVCPRCEGKGMVAGETCQYCSGHGIVLEGIAGA